MQSIGIGKVFAESHKEYVLSDKGMRRDGKPVAVPRYYRKKLIEKDSVEEMEYRRKCEERRLK